MLFMFTVAESTTIPPLHLHAYCQPIFHSTMTVLAPPNPCECACVFNMSGLLCKDRQPCAGPHGVGSCAGPARSVDCTQTRGNWLLQPFNEGPNFKAQESNAVISSSIHANRVAGYGVAERHSVSLAVTAATNFPHLLQKCRNCELFDYYAQTTRNQSTSSARFPIVRHVEPESEVGGIATQLQQFIIAVGTKILSFFRADLG